MKEERIKSFLEEQTDTILILFKERDYWKARCEAAEEVISQHDELQIYHPEDYQRWQELKDKKI